MADQINKATANPTKSFFVRMLTRDISLEDCILDLIDNSVDGAWRMQGSAPMGLEDHTDLSSYSIVITATPDKFSITDNCGGMTLDDAVDHAFSFGRQVQDEHDDYGIGVYGIGMKRAVFKIGTVINIHSTYLDLDGNSQSFAVPINVTEWLKNDVPPWDFDIVEADLLDRNGVSITIEHLTSGAETSFGSPAFIQNLRRTIARDYSFHLDRGLNVSINDVPIQGWKIELRQSEEFAPMRLRYQTIVEGGEVSVELIGGMAAPPPESSDPEEDDEGERRFGWFVVCNGRIVLAADKTSISGWGTDDWPSWHRQYSGFIGIILFTAANPVALPLTTTKRSVDVSSEVFRQARPRMKEVTRHWIAYTNQRKQSLVDAKEKEAATLSIPIYSVAPLTHVRLPTLVAKPVQKPANIAYSVPVPKLRKLAKELGNINMTYRDVGLETFAYTYRDLVGDE